MTTTIDPRSNPEKTKRCHAGELSTGDKGGRSTSLDPLETSGPVYRWDPDQDLPTYATPTEHAYAKTTNCAQAFRHGCWRPLRGRVLRALVETGQSINRRLRFATCGSTFHVLQSTTDPTKYRLAANACHDRFCLPCASERARIVAFNMQEHLATNPCRFITLTIKSDSEPLEELLEKLYSSFKRLRTHKTWKRTQAGGIAFLEIKWNDKTERWHPHFHVLAQGKFIAHDQLRKAWKEITGDSHIVDVRLVRDNRHATAYVTKYASKPFEAKMLRTYDRLCEAINALRARRMILTFGTWKGVRVTRSPEPGEWAKVGTVAALARLAITGDNHAETIIRTVLGDRADDFFREALRDTGHDPPPDVPMTHDYFVAAFTASYW